jgi:hypothetical protein
LTGYRNFWRIFSGELEWLEAAHREVFCHCSYGALLLIARLNGGGVYTQGYVDGICVLVVGKFPNTVSERIQWALPTVEMWCDELRLSVNPVKTGITAFIRRRKLQGFFEPHLLE